MKAIFLVASDPLPPGSGSNLICSPPIPGSSPRNSSPLKDDGNLTNNLGKKTFSCALAAEYAIEPLLALESFRVGHFAHIYYSFTHTAAMNLNDSTATVTGSAEKTVSILGTTAEFTIPKFKQLLFCVFK